MLILGGISGAGMVTFLQDYRPIFMAVTFGFLGSAFYLTYRPRRAAATCNGDEQAAVSKAAQSRSRIMAFNKVTLWVVTAVAIVFLFFPQAAASLSGPSDEVTADMQQTVVAIEGMT